MRKHRHHKHKSEHRRRDNSKEQEPFTNLVKTNITQEIQVNNRQGYQCIIKLNTTICNYENNHQKSDEPKSPRSPTDMKHCNIIQRSVPHCFRTACHEPQQKIRAHIRQHNEQQQCKSKRQHHHRDRKSQTLVRTKQVHSKHGHHRHTKHSKKIIQNKTKSLHDIKQELKYEDISSTSFESYLLEKPSSYKDVTKVFKKHVSKLDTLIKRTKERERKLVEQSRKSCHKSTSTPAYTEVSSIDFSESCSEIDLSLHSKSTLVIAPQEVGNTPSIGGFFRSPKTDVSLHSSKSTLIIEPTDTGYSPIESFYISPKSKEMLYTPISPDQNENSWTSDFEFKIKSESSMDIEAYSPTQSPKMQLFELDKTIKKKLKIENKLEKALDML